MIRNSIRKRVPAELRRAIAKMTGRAEKNRVRRYIPKGVSVAEFFDTLNAASVRCVVLRWFDNLPTIEPGEDIDMLVSDDDLPKLGQYLDNYAGSVPCDVYTVAGAEGARFKGHAYYPRKLAEQSIERRKLLHDRYPVPSQEDYFLGLAYHAVYHKGPQSGLLSGLAGVEVMKNPDHDYTGILQNLSLATGIDVPITLDTLDAFLATKDYRPSHNVLSDLGQNNAWIRAKFLS